MDSSEPTSSPMEVLDTPSFPRLLPLDDDATLGVMSGRSEGPAVSLLPEDRLEETVPSHREGKESAVEEKRKQRRAEREKQRRQRHLWSLTARVASIGAEADRIAVNAARTRDDLYVPLPSLSSLPSFELETLQSAAARRAEEIVSTVCKKTLQAIMQHKWSWPFNTPVDVTVYKDYLEKVQEPMDFGAIKKKLDRGEYHNPESFLKDMRLVFDNARLYNKPGTDVYVMASTLREKFEEKVASTITPRMMEAASIGDSDILAARQRHAGNLAPFESSGQLPGSSISEARKAAELRCASLIQDLDALLSVVSDTKSAAAALCTPLSRKEKEELAVSLGTLSESDFEIAIGLVLLQHPGLQPFDDIGFDLDMLDALTLRQLQSFVVAAEARRDVGTRQVHPAETENPKTMSWPGVLIGTGIKGYKPKKRIQKEKRKRFDESTVSAAKKDIASGSITQETASMPQGIEENGADRGKDGARRAEMEDVDVVTPVVSHLAPAAASNAPVEHASLPESKVSDG